MSGMSQFIGDRGLKASVVLNFAEQISNCTILQDLRGASGYAVKYGLEKLNEEVSAWMMGLITEDGTKSRPPFLAMGSSNSVMWNRDFGQERFKSFQQRWKACTDVEGMLKLLGARQLIIGHTPQVRLSGILKELPCTVQQPWTAAKTALGC